MTTSKRRFSLSISHTFPVLIWGLLVLWASACGGHGPSKASPSYSGGNSGQGYTHTASGYSSADAPATRTAASSTRSFDGASESAADSAFSPTPSEPSRPGLGTSFGEARESSVVHRRFVRSTSQPFAEVAIFYNDMEGVREQSWFRGQGLRELRARTRSGGLAISLVDESGNILPGGVSGDRTYVVGQDGQRYSLHIQNNTGGRFEVVASVDGLDVVDGEPASFGKRGYVIAPYSELVIDGFRTSMNSVAAFRFGSVRDSYAAQTSGDRNVGVIGFAFFAEQGSRYQRDEILRRETADPFPGRFSVPPGMAR